MKTNRPKGKSHNGLDFIAFDGSHLYSWQWVEPDNRAHIHIDFDPEIGEVERLLISPHLKHLSEVAIRLADYHRRKAIREHAIKAQAEGRCRRVYVINHPVTD